MEVEASLRLFGGYSQLAHQLEQAREVLDIKQIAWASNSLAALTLARAGQSGDAGLRSDESPRFQSLKVLLDPLSIDHLSAAAKHRDVLLRAGCMKLGQLCALPRGGISRRFDADLLLSLDRLYGLCAEAHEWIAVPEQFRHSLELMASVDQAPALLFAAKRLLHLMSAWLTARRVGVTAFKLSWRHDVMASRSAGTGGELILRTAKATRDVTHLCGLLSEHLAKTVLLAPAGALSLEVITTQDYEEHSQELFAHRARPETALQEVLERIAVRLGSEKIRRPLPVQDHRPEAMYRWQVVTEAQPLSDARHSERNPSRLPLLPGSATRRKAIRTSRSKPRLTQPLLNAHRLHYGLQPSFLLAEPLALHTQNNRPFYKGRLQLLIGPHRVEGGWWDRIREGDEAETTRYVARDYWVAQSEHGGMLWIYQQRLMQLEAPAWFLQGVFA